jgi:transcriptional regulator with XRE-family HTH domain
MSRACGAAPTILLAQSGRKRPPVPEVRSPTLRRRELGTLLRTLRQQQGLTVEQVAEQLLCSPSKVSRMETGQRGVTRRDIRDLCELYSVSDEETVGRLTNLAREGKEHGWWQPYGLDYATYVDLEEAAASLRYYQSSLVPGILQTPDYARAVHEAGVQEYAPGRIDEHVDVRMRRQRLLTQVPPLKVSIVLDEAVLHRSVGGSAVMAEQLGHLAERATLPSVSIQVIPFSAGAHPAMDSMFDILEFRESALPSVVYVEGLMGWLYIEQSEDISRYVKVFNLLRAAALAPKESIRLIAEMQAQHNSAALLPTHINNV